MENVLNSVIFAEKSGTFSAFPFAAEVVFTRLPPTMPSLSAVMIEVSPAFVELVSGVASSPLPVASRSTSSPLAPPMCHTPMNPSQTLAEDAAICSAVLVSP